MNVVFEHILFFAVGFSQDLLITYYYQAIAKDWPYKSAALSFLVTIVNILVIYKIITGIEDRVLTVILVYALGNAVGTYAVVRRHKNHALHG